MLNFLISPMFSKTFAKSLVRYCIVIHGKPRSIDTHITTAWSTVNKIFILSAIIVKDKKYLFVMKQIFYNTFLKKYS